MKIEFSIDDGDLKDYESYRILNKYRFNNKSIFYFPINYRLSRYNLDMLANFLNKQGCNIGSHTLNHRKLSYLSYIDQLDEIIEGKKQLEKIIGKEIKSFAYPRGWHTNQTIRAVKSSGHFEARTMNQGVFDNTGYSKFQKPITLHFHPSRINELDIREIFNKSKEGGYFHLTWHSWEIDKYNLWNELDNYLKHIYENIDS